MGGFETAERSLFGGLGKGILEENIQRTHPSKRGATVKCFTALDWCLQKKLFRGIMGTS